MEVEEVEVLKAETVGVPDKIKEEANIACSKLIPSKSKEIYEKEYQNYCAWKVENGVSGINEDIMLAYFHNLHKKCASSSVWTKYSMLKSMLKLYNNVDISKYGKLVAYLKSQSRTHKPKKARVLQKEHIEKFLQDAPDNQYLMTKVALLMGIFGACRCQELTNMSIDDIEDKESYLLVSVPDTKTYKPRSFTVIQEGSTVDALKLYREYISLRPKKLQHRRLFLNYKNRKCSVQPVGINNLSKIPFQVATFLNLPEPESYTGHSLRRSSATLLVNGGGDITALKRHGGWRSNTVAEGYIEESICEKINNAKKIRGTLPEMPSVSISSTCNVGNTPAGSNVIATKENVTVTLNINVNVNKD